MVHTWISICNEKINSPCLNNRILRIFKNKHVNMYGDYNLDIYIGTKYDYTNIEQVISKVINRGWINIKISDIEPIQLTHLEQYISYCGDIPYNEFKKIFPRRENYIVTRGFKLRNDGNFFMYACETTKFYYVICFVTS